MPLPDDLLASLPGEELIRPGLADFTAGRLTIPACLVSIGLPRLQRAGLLPQVARPPALEAELTLYRLLRQEGGNAYARYNALIRRLVSFERALDRRRGRESRWEKLKVESRK